MKNPSWPATKARLVLAALLRKGWRIKRQRGSHRTIGKPGWPDYIFAYHDRVELGRGALELLGRKRACVRAISRLRRERNDHVARDSLAMLQTICNHPQRERLSGGPCLLASPPINRDARKRWNVRDPPPVVLAREFDFEIKRLGLIRVLHCYQIECNKATNT